MNQIRTDKTKSTKATRADWELNAWEEDGMSQRDIETQDAIVQGWTDIWNSGDKSRIAEMDLARRISAVAEDDTLEKRVEQVIKEVKANAIIEQKLQDLQHAGQTPEDFADEQDAFGRTYRRIAQQAFKEVGL